MSQPVPLEYDHSESRRTWSVPAIFALVLGVFSGPIMVVLVQLTGIAYGISIVGGGIAGVIGVVITVYCLWACIWTQGRSRKRGRNLALIGFIATFCWTVDLIALFGYVDAHLE